MDREELIKTMELLIETCAEKTAPYRELFIKAIAQLKAASERIAELELQFQRIDRMKPSAALDEISKIAEGLE